MLRAIFPAGLTECPKDRCRGFVGVNLPFGMPLDAERKRRGIFDDEPLDQVVIGSGLDRESISEPVYRLRMQRINRGVRLAGNFLEQTAACE